MSPVVGSCSAVFQQDGVVGHSSLNKPDVVLSSLDHIIFHVHLSVLTKSSTCLFTPHAVIQTDGKPNAISESAEVLNVILHALYCMPCVQFSPSLLVLERALERMELAHEMDIHSYTLSLTSLHTALFMHAHLDPVKLYAMAGHFGMENLATAVSPHLLSIDLYSLTDADFERMGPIYTNRLLILQVNRRKALKTILTSFSSGDEHAPQCSIHGQENIQSAWAKSASVFAWDAKVHGSIGLLDSAHPHFLLT